MARLKALIDYHRCRHDWGRARDHGMSMTRLCRKNPNHAQIYMATGMLRGPFMNRWYRWDGIAPE